MRINLTLAGGGRGSSGAGVGLFGNLASSALKVANKNKVAGQPYERPQTPTPPPPAAPPTGNIRDQAMNIGSQAAKRTGAENIRNRGGGRGTDIGSAVRALKGLTGQ